MAVAAATALSGAGWIRSADGEASAALPHIRLPLAAARDVSPLPVRTAGRPQGYDAGRRQAPPMVFVPSYSWSEDPPQILSDGADSVELKVAVAASFYPPGGIREGDKALLKIECVTDGAEMEYFPWDGVSEAELNPGGAVNVTFKITASLYNTFHGRVRFRVKLIDVQRREGGDYKSILEDLYVPEGEGEIVTADGEKTKTLAVTPKK